MTSFIRLQAFILGGLEGRPSKEADALTLAVLVMLQVHTSLQNKAGILILRASIKAAEATIESGLLAEYVWLKAAGT